MAAGAKLKARVDGQAAGAEALRAEDEEDTQTALRIMRRWGDSP